MKAKTPSKRKTVKLLKKYEDPNINGGSIERNEWEKNVYHPSESDMNPVWWKEIRTAILIRDHYRCYRCEKKRHRGLTVHHIIPREEGGEDYPENLITLCGPCHDLVELFKCRSLTEIDATIDEEMLLGREPKKKELPVIEKEETFERPAWHAWVYGGERGPR